MKRGTTVRCIELFLRGGKLQSFCVYILQRTGNPFLDLCVQYLRQPRALTPASFLYSLLFNRNQRAMNDVTSEKRAFVERSTLAIVSKVFSCCDGSPGGSLHGIGRSFLHALIAGDPKPSKLHLCPRVLAEPRAHPGTLVCLPRFSLTLCHITRKPG